MNLAPVVFDAYGTLFDPQSLADPLEQAFPGRGRELAATWRATQVRHTWLRSLMGAWADFDAITRESLAQTLQGAPALDDAARGRLIDGLLDTYRRLPAYSDVVAALAAFDPARPRAILTNGTSATVAATVTAAGLGSRLPTILSAAEVSIYKPAPQVYALATAAFGVGPADITFVSGNAWDCAGAGVFGFRVVRIRRSAEAEEVIGPRPAATIDSLADLAELLP